MAAARLFFEDATGDPEPVSAMQLGIMLNRSSLRLVMLDACQGGKLATDPFRRLAPALIRAQIPAVVAMQFGAREATRAFAGEFYRALAEGFPIDACVTEGRKAVMNASGLEQSTGASRWSTPARRMAGCSICRRPRRHISGQIVFPAGELWRGGAVQVSSADGVLLFPAGPPQIERLDQKPRPPRRVRGSSVAIVSWPRSKASSSQMVVRGCTGQTAAGMLAVCARLSTRRQRARSRMGWPMSRAAPSHHSWTMCSSGCSSDFTALAQRLRSILRPRARH